LSLETVTEVSEFVEEDNVSVGNPLDHLIDGVITIKNSVRGSIAEMFTSHVADDFEDTGIAASVHRYFGNSTVTLPDLKARSLNYTLAGQLVTVFGLTGGGDCYTIGDRPDILLQHHATSYRKLIKTQLLGKATGCQGGD